MRNLIWSLKVSAFGSLNFALVHRTEPHPNPLCLLVAGFRPLDLHPTVLRSSPDSFSSLPAWHSKESGVQTQGRTTPPAGSWNPARPLALAGAVPPHQRQFPWRESYVAPLSLPCKFQGQRLAPTPGAGPCDKAHTSSLRPRRPALPKDFQRQPALGTLRSSCSKNFYAAPESIPTTNSVRLLQLLVAIECCLRVQLQLTIHFFSF